MVYSFNTLENVLLFKCADIGNSLHLSNTKFNIYVFVFPLPNRNFLKNQKSKEHEEAKTRAIVYLGTSHMSSIPSDGFESSFQQLPKHCPGPLSPLCCTWHPHLNSWPKKTLCQWPNTHTCMTPSCQIQLPPISNPPHVLTGCSSFLRGDCYFLNFLDHDLHSKITFF